MIGGEVNDDNDAVNPCGCESKIGTLLAEVMVLMVESKNSRSKK